MNKKTRKIYYYLDHLLQVHEIRWFRTKFVGSVILSIICCMMLLLAVNHYLFDFLGLGYTQINTLTQENKALQDQLHKLSARIGDLTSEVNKLDTQGNQLRLLVDLQSVDDQTRSAGTGGAVVEPDLNFTADSTARFLNNTMSTLQHIESEIKVQEQSYGQIVRKYDYNKGFFAAMPAIKPMEGFYSVKGFGLRMHPVLGIFKTHEGLDIVNDVGTPVYAAGDGVVEMAGHSGGGYGVVVVIKHGYGYQTLYAHLSKVLVREGQRVKRGDLIAKSGNTGLVTGPHLHYEVRYNGVFQNPSDYFFDDVTAAQYRAQLAAR